MARRTRRIEPKKNISSRDTLKGVASIRLVSRGLAVRVQVVSELRDVGTECIWERRDAGAILAASIFSELASTSDTSRHLTSKDDTAKDVATHKDRPNLRQEATTNGGTRPSRATESATRPLSVDPDLAVVLAAWRELIVAVRAGIIAMVKAAKK
jgi:hypothetical protein